MRCPICKQACVPHGSGGGEFEECAAGHGLLVQGARLVAVMEELARREGVGHAEVQELLVKDVQRPAHERRRCPNCWADMEMFNYAYNSNIFLDRCARCGMVWIDAAERARVMRYVRGNPKVDGLAAALAACEEERMNDRDPARQRPETWFETCVKEAVRPGQPLLTRLMFAGLAVLIAVVVLYAVWLRVQRYR